VGNLVIPVWVVAAVAVALVLVVVVFTARRLVLSRSRGSFDCSFRRRVDAGEGGWASGIAHYGPGELRWYRMFSLHLRPSRVWRRSDMSIKEFRAPQGGEVYAVLPGAAERLGQPCGFTLRSPGRQVGERGREEVVGGQELAVEYPGHPGQRGQSAGPFEQRGTGRASRVAELDVPVHSAAERLVLRVPAPAERVVLTR